ncbi:hypothetical protein MD537_12630 [Flavihumibacter sediminis]|nr:hypothetical protein [Flavihumibacter sediminis]
MRKLVGSILILAAIGGIVSCGKETDTPDEALLTDYFNLAPGSQVNYQLDSIIKAPFQDTSFIVRSYEARDVVDAEITDNLGRKSWRVFRSLRPLGSSSESAWQESDTYMITPTLSVVEVIENNLRFQKLIAPIRDGKEWKGNSYINAVPGEELAYLYNWTYRYQDIDASHTSFEQVIPNTITVQQQDDELNSAGLGPLDPSQNGYRVFSKEIYAKGIGLVYKELIYWDFQSPATTGNEYPNGLKEGGGIRMQVLSWK